VKKIEQVLSMLDRWKVIW